MKEKTVCFLVKPEMFQSIFAPSSVKAIEKVGKVRVWNGNKEPQDFCRSAAVIVTSWGSPKIDLSFLESSPELRLIAHAAGSIKALVDEKLMERGVKVCSASDVLGRNVAITAFGLILTSVKRVWEWNLYLKQGGRWRDDERLKKLTDEIGGVTVGIIGASQVGRTLIGLLKPLCNNLLLYDPYLADREAGEMGVKKAGELLELASKSDIVSLCAPLTDETRGMLKKEFFESMKNGAVFVNTARGAILDERALVEELEKGRISACLDVTDPEPPAEDSPLRKLDNVLLTPHLAGCANSGFKEIGRSIVEEIVRFMNSNRLSNEIKLDRLAHLA